MGFVGTHVLDSLGPYCHSVQEGSLTSYGRIDLVHAGIANDPDGQLSINDQCHANGHKRNPSDEVQRPIYRVDDPRRSSIQRFLRGSFRRTLLGQNPMVRISPEQSPNQQLLNLAVILGDHVKVGPLGVHRLGRVTESFQHQRTGLFGEPQRELERLLNLLWVHRDCTKLCGPGRKVCG